MNRAELQEWMGQRDGGLAKSFKKAPPQIAEVGRTQTSKAIEVAKAAESLSLFINWLRYQAAREKEREKFWSQELPDGKILAEAIAADVNEIKGKVTKEELMKSIALYLGYFRRAFIGLEFLDRIKAP